MKLLAAEGHTVGYKRVARLMKAANLSVAVKRACQTTHSADSPHPWQNRLKTLDITRCDQVWVGDITYVRLKHRFVYVALLMDVFTRMIRGWNLNQHLTQSLTLHPLEQALHEWVSRDPSFRSRCAVSFKRLIRTLKEEEVHLNDYQDIHEARERIEHFITQVYPLKRPHSALGYLTPMEFQQEKLET